MLDLALQQEGIKSELVRSCASLSLSLDMWTSKNKLSMLGVIGYWCDGTYKMLFNEGSFVDCTIEDTKLQKEEKEGRGESWP
jgi:hypothetical protein